MKDPNAQLPAGHPDITQADRHAEKLTGRSIEQPEGVAEPVPENDTSGTSADAALGDPDKPNDPPPNDDQPPAPPAIDEVIEPVPGTPEYEAAFPFKAVDADGTVHNFGSNEVADDYVASHEGSSRLYSEDEAAKQATDSGNGSAGGDAAGNA